jgi:hypothetical protein
MPPPQQLLSSAVSIITKWLNPTFLVLLTFLIVALPLSTPSDSITQQSSASASLTSSPKSPSTSSSSSSLSPNYNKKGFNSGSNSGSPNNPESLPAFSGPSSSSRKQQRHTTSEGKQQRKWPHWSVNAEEVCPSARIWATAPGKFCVTLWNSPYLSNRTELEVREKRAIQFYCEMDSILERFDCAQEYSVNVRRGQCTLCRVMPS